MSDFSIEKYQAALTEIRERLLAAEILSKHESVVFIESTALQVRKILELIAYLSLLVNEEKLSHKEKNDWHADRIINYLISKTTIFYPLPCRIIAPQSQEEEPVLIPLSTKLALSQADFNSAYSNCGKILHAQHPFKDEIDFRRFSDGNKEALRKIKNLLHSHVIAIRHDSKKYTFLSVEFDFTNGEDSRPTVIQEYKTRIFDEAQLKSLFESFWGGS
jgi:hypothetical protein